MNEPQFFQIVTARNTHKDGTVKDPKLMRRMRNPICRACQESYWQKFPDQPFQIYCDGVPDEPDFQEMSQKSGVPYEEARDTMDKLYWAERHTYLTDDRGDVKPFKARDYQVPMLKCTARRKVDRCGRGLGKALAIDTPIPTPAGWVTMSDLQVGDTIFDEKGQPAKVTFVTEIMRGRPCYDVLFSDGSVLTADAEHLWETWTHAARKSIRRRRGKTRRETTTPQVRTTEEIRSTLLHGNGKRVEHNHSVRVCEPLQHPTAELPVDPYVLGAWLGDGSTDSTAFTCNDWETLAEIHKAGYAISPRAANFMYGIGVKQHQRNELGQMTDNGSLSCQLGKMGLLSNKHVPEIYLRSSYSQRLALLQGFMDTDGTASRSGFCSFDNSNLKLSDAVAELAISLGFKVTRHSRIPVLNGKEYPRSYRVWFNPTLPVFRLPRKLARQKLAKVRSCTWHRFIVEVKPRESVPVKCIQVASPSHLYLAGKSCIPTHNTSLGIIEELHAAMNHKNYPIMVAAPAKSQAQKWFDDILWQAEQCPEIARSIVQKQQQPFYKIKFTNGSTISIFTCGSASGRGADVIRSQTPRRERLEEQDALNEEDYKALQPLFRRYRNSEFHGASTPKGDHSTFWAMCTQYPDYKEFHVPITRHPDWGPEMEEACRREARTNINYVHEFLADFGNPEEGVFKAAFVDWARKPYRYEECRYDAQCKYVMGVDWNGEGTGTRIRVIEYNPVTAMRRVVAFETIDGDEVATLDFLNSIRNLNRVWHCDRVYVDAGFGYIQDSLIRDLGRVAEVPEDRKLEYVRVVDFGATLKTNKLIPRRGKFKYLRQDDLDRRTKPFMVEGAVAVLEQHLFEFSDKDAILDAQMRSYRVKTWSAHGHANTYEAGREGDHDLDATLLALLGIELEFGLFAQAPLPPAMVRHIPTVHQSDVPVRSRADTVPSRQMVSPQQRRRVAFASRNSWIEIPGRASPSGPRTEIPSRTSRIQRPSPRGPMGRRG